MKTIAVICSLFLTFGSLSAKSLEKVALEKMDSFKELISKAEQTGVDTERAKMVLGSAEIYMFYTNASCSSAGSEQDLLSELDTKHELLILLFEDAELVLKHEMKEFAHAGKARHA